MRLTMIMAVAAAAVGLGFSQPASAGGWDDGCCGGNVYIHHHVYYPPRYIHVYQYHRPFARHINVVHYGYDCCGYAARGAYRWHWRRYW
jgi:hypothetical protein